MKKTILLTFLLLVFLGLYAQKGKFKKAIKTNTIEAFEDFLINYPESEYAEEINMLLVEKKWGKAFELNSLDGYKTFLEEFPDNPFKEKAEKKYDSINFKVANEANSIEAYENYINDPYAKKNNINLATNKIDSLVYMQALSKGDLEDYLYYEDKFPDGLYITEVKLKIDSLVYIQALSKADLEDFIYYEDNFPDGLYITEVKSKIDSMRYINVHRDDHFSILNFIKTRPDGKYIDLLIEDMTDNVYYNRCVEYQSLRMIEYYKRRFPKGRFIKQADQLYQQIVTDIRKNLQKCIIDTTYRHEYLQSSPLPHAKNEISLTDISNANFFILNSWTSKPNQGGLSFYGVIAATEAITLIKDVDKILSQCGVKINNQKLQRHLIIFDIMSINEFKNSILGTSEILVIVNFEVWDTQKMKVVYSNTNIIRKQTNDTKTKMADMLDIPVSPPKSDKSEITPGVYDDWDFGNFLVYSDPLLDVGNKRIYFLLNIPKKLSITFKKSYKEVLKIEHDSDTDFGYRMFEIGRFDNYSLDSEYRSYKVSNTGW